MKLTKLVKVFKVQNRDGKSAIRIYFNYNGNYEYCMDMNKKQPNGPCTVTFWRKCTNGLTYLYQITGKHMNPSVRSAMRCIEEFLKKQEEIDE